MDVWVPGGAQGPSAELYLLKTRNALQVEDSMVLDM